MKTIAQQLNIKEFPFKINDSNGNQIYYENSFGIWEKKEFNSNNSLIYYESSFGYWEKKEFDSNSNIIYYENSKGSWYKKEYDSNNRVIYYENSDGVIVDNKPKVVELTLDEIASKLGIEVSQLKRLKIVGELN